MDGKQQDQVYHPHDSFRELITRYEPEHRAIWCYMRPTGRPCFTFELLSELESFYLSVEQLLNRAAECGSHDGPRFLIMASRVPGVFNLGGDLTLFLKLIRAGNRERLFHYAKSCIDLLYVGYRLPITTISLVQGDALGGGFEGALMSRVVIAERRAQMGFPEILFNLFPGMGAYNLLASRLNPARAEQFILSGRTYSAEELFNTGVVDILADNDEGESAVYSYIKKHNRAHNGYAAIHKIRQIYHLLDYDVLIQIVTIWVDTALQLSERDLRVMERFAQSQEKLVTLRPSTEIRQLA